MKNILVTGANGQLGNEMRVLSAEYKEYTCFYGCSRNWTFVMSRR